MTHENILNTTISFLAKNLKGVEKIECKYVEDTLSGNISEVDFFFNKRILKFKFLHKSRLIVSSIIKVPYHDVQDYLSIHEFLARNLNKYDTNLFCIDRYSGDEDEKLRSFLDFFIMILNNHFLPILNGKKWVVDYFPDWTKM